MEALSPAEATWPHRPGQAVSAQGGQELRGAKWLPRWLCTPHPVTSPLRATAMVRVSTSIVDVIRSLIEQPTIRPTRRP